MLRNLPTLVSANMEMFRGIKIRLPNVVF